MIKTTRRLLLCTIVLLTANLISLTAETQGDNEPWRILERGQLALEDGEAGEALALCDKARNAHRQSINSSIDILKAALLPREVKKAGDDLLAVYSVLQKREESDALAVLDDALLNHSASFFGDSVSQVIAWFESRRVYPEADFLTGKIYESEGENRLAISFYAKAWENKSFFDIPDERFTLAYRMAEVSRTIGDYDSQEMYLLAVVKEDPLFGKPGEESTVLTFMQHTINSDASTDDFFRLYRHDNFTALKAYQDLAALYYYGASQRLDRALPVALLAGCISVTGLSKAMEQADFEYSYKGLPELMVRVSKKPEIISWAKETEVWKSFMIMASILYDQGKRQQAVAIWTALAGYCPDLKTAKTASKALESRKQ